MARMSPPSPGIERLVERSMRNWEIAKTQQPPTAGAQPTVHHYVAISREYGSRAAFIGPKLARALGWSYFHREILDFMATSESVRHRLYQTLDERQQSWLEEVIASFRTERVSGLAYFRALTQAVLTIASHESAVFVGRGAGFMLPSDKGLHVRTVAPLSFRVNEIARRLSISPEPAKDLIAKTDRERLRFAESHFGRDAADPARYDLVVNTEPFTDLALCELMVAALNTKCKLNLTLT